jgi:hypothetical protein
MLDKDQERVYIGTKLVEILKEISPAQDYLLSIDTPPSSALLLTGIKDIVNYLQLHLANHPLNEELVEKLVSLKASVQNIGQKDLSLKKSEDKIAKAVNPAHYQGYIEDMQWIDAVSRIPTLRNPVALKGAIELQFRGYLDRAGRKDDPIQEYKKARWWLNYLIAYLENGERPILVKDVERLKDL